MGVQYFVDIISPRMMTVPIDTYSDTIQRGSGGFGTRARDALEWNFSKQRDENSVSLFQASANGSRLGTVTFRALKDDKLYLRVLLPNSVIGSYEVNAEQDRFTIFCDKPVYFVSRVD